MTTQNDRALSGGERRLLFNLISYTIADLTPVAPFTEEKPPEENAHATKLWKAHLSRHKEDMLNHVTAMAFAVDGEPIVLHSGREMTFKDCLLELGMANAEHFVEELRKRPEDFGRNADILLRKETIRETIQETIQDAYVPEDEPEKIEDRMSVGF